MSEEVKQNLILNYTNLLRIKAAEKDTNEELERQLIIAKIALSSYNIDLEALEKAFLG